jgi:hypothetical protein
MQITLFWAVAPCSDNDVSDEPKKFSRGLGLCGIEGTEAVQLFCTPSGGEIQCVHKVHSGFCKIVARKQIELRTCGLRQITTKLWKFLLDAGRWNERPYLRFSVNCL